MRFRMDRQMTQATNAANDRRRCMLHGACRLAVRDCTAALWPLMSRRRRRQQEGTTSRERMSLFVHVVVGIGLLRSAADRWVRVCTKTASALVVCLAYRTSRPVLALDI